MGWPKRHPYATAAAGGFGAYSLMGNGESDPPDMGGMPGSESQLSPTDALSTFERMYLNQLGEAGEGQRAIREELEGAKLSTREKIGRILLEAGAGAALADRGKWVGGLLGGAAGALAQLTEEERSRVNELIALYRAGELSKTQLLGELSRLQSSRASSGKAPLTASQWMSLHNEGMEPEQILQHLQTYDAFMGTDRGPQVGGVDLDFTTQYDSTGVRRR